MRLLLLGLLILLPATATAQDESLRAGAIRFLTTGFLDTVPRGHAVCVSINGGEPTDAELAALRAVRPVDPPTDCTCALKDANRICLRDPDRGDCRVDLKYLAIESPTRATMDVSYECGPFTEEGVIANFVRVDGEWIFESIRWSYAE